MSDRFYEAWAVGSQVVAAVLFAVAMVVIWNRYIAPAVVHARARKNDQIAEMEHRRDEAKAKVDVATAEHATAQHDVREIGVRADRDAAGLAERIVADAEAEGRRQMRAAEGELERSRYAAREALRAEIVAKAVAIARESAARLDDATNRGLVSGVIDDVTKKDEAR